VAEGAVRPVQDQGQCSKGDYAFSAIGAIEGIAYLYYKLQNDFSAQEIIDCSTAYGNNGCQGGSMVNSFNFIKARGKG
jgi:cathepsin L